MFIELQCVCAVGDVLHGKIEVTCRYNGFMWKKEGVGGRYDQEWTQLML